MHRLWGVVARGERARALRRAHNLKAPDALHLACALELDLDMFITCYRGDLLGRSPLLRCNGTPLSIDTPAAAIGGPLFGAPS